jgi:hypothetical protein
LGADEVSGESWQLVSAIHDGGDGLIYCNLWVTLKAMTALILVTLGLALEDLTQQLTSSVIVESWLNRFTNIPPKASLWPTRVKGHKIE